MTKFAENTCNSFSLSQVIFAQFLTRNGIKITVRKYIKNKSYGEQTTKTKLLLGTKTIVTKLIIKKEQSIGTEKVSKIKVFFLAYVQLHADA